MTTTNPTNRGRSARPNRRAALLNKPVALVSAHISVTALMATAAGVCLAFPLSALAQGLPPQGVTPPLALEFQSILLRGQSLPMVGPGVTATNFSRGPVINRSGQVLWNQAFAGPGVTTANDSALILYTPGGGGSLAMGLRFGTPLPGAAAGVSVSTLPTAVNLSDSGSIVQLAGLDGAGIDSSNNRALVTGPLASAALVAQTGNPTNTEAISTPVVNASGHYAYLINHLGTRTRALLMGSPGSAPAPVLSLGNAAPGFAPGATISHLSTPTISDTGRVAMWTDVQLTPGVTRATLYTGNAGGFQRVASAGDAAPGIGGGTLTEFYESPSMNRGGDLAFPAWTSTSNPGVFMASAASPGVLTAVFRGGTETLPGMPAGSRPSEIWDVSIGDSGSVAFRAKMQETTGLTSFNNEGLWMSRGGQLTTVAREGDQAPQMAAGVVLAGTPSFQSGVNARDQMAFRMLLSGPGVTSSNNEALWAWDPNVGLFAVVREGDLFQVAPGDVRTILTIGFSSSRQLNSMDATFLPAGTGGIASGLNDSGQLALGLTFTNGTGGIFTTTIPAPSGVLAIGLGGLALVSVRRRAR